MTTNAIMPGGDPDLFPKAISERMEITEPQAFAREDADRVGPPSGDALDDQLLSRDLKSRLFGTAECVTIGRYELLGAIGQGGMSTVYLARDPELDRKIALKVVREDRASARDRMLAEGRALALLAHPNVVVVHEVGTHEGRVFLAMELVEGETLRAWLRHHKPRHKLLDAFAQAARGLQVAHAAGLVHRDFKPENVIVGKDGRVRVVDFGVVKSHGMRSPAAQPSEEDEVGLTATGQLLGTPAYMAAEQFLGEAVDARTDVFALCVSLHEAFAGHRPFDERDPKALVQEVTLGRPSRLALGRIPRALARMVVRGLSPRPTDRPTLAALISALESTRARERARAGIIATTAIACLAIPWVAYHTMDDGDEAHAYEAFLASDDEEDRLGKARDFIAEYGTADAARRAVAHATIGSILWDRSCPHEESGLCVRSLPLLPADRCATPWRGPFERIARDLALRKEALQHFSAAMGFGGIDAPGDPDLANAWRDAIGRARVTIADDRLEPYLALSIPELDTANAPKLSNAAFKAVFDRMVEDSSALSSAYAQAKGTTTKWEVTAGLRSGAVFEHVSESFAALPIPPALKPEERTPYCKEIDERAISLGRTHARQTYGWCAERAERGGLAHTPEAAICRAGRDR